MTPTRNGLRDRTSRHAREIEAERRIEPRHLPGPGFARSRTSGTELVLRRMMVDGRRRTRAEAAATFAHESWAGDVVGAGMSGPYYCWERPGGQGMAGASSTERARRTR